MSTYKLTFNGFILLILTHPPFFSGKQPDGAVENNQNKGKILGCGMAALCVFSCLA